jgi:hypothetical protein
MPVVRGSCLCGGVRFEIDGVLSAPLNCHCVNCRKQHGAAFRSRARVQIADFKWVRGEELVTYFESSPGFQRGFCRICGSPIVNRPGPGSLSAQVDPSSTSQYGVPLGILDDDPNVRPQSHIFVRSKAPWFDFTDNLPQFDAI